MLPMIYGMSISETVEVLAASRLQLQSRGLALLALYSKISVLYDIRTSMVPSKSRIPVRHVEQFAAA